MICKIMEKLHPIDIRERIEDGLEYRVEGHLRMKAQGARLYFDNLLRLGFPIEEIARKIEKIRPIGKINLLNENI